MGAGMDGASDWSEDEEKTGRLLNQEISKRLDIQRQSGAAVDTKAGIVAAAALTAITFLAAQKNLHVSLWVVSLFMLAVTVILAYGCLRTRDFTEVPEPKPLYLDYRDFPVAYVLYNLAITKAEAFEFNRAIYKRKAVLQQLSLWTLAAAAVLGVAARLAGGS
jgi:hypothetical protein